MASGPIRSAILIRYGSDTQDDKDGDVLTKK